LPTAALTELARAVGVAADTLANGAVLLSRASAWRISLGQKNANALPAAPAKLVSAAFA
jgi:hypothetical protein